MVAGHVEPAWFQTILEVWHANLEDRPTAMMIAWHCISFEAHEAAVTAARAALARYPDMDTYPGELAFLESLYGETTQAEPAAAGQGASDTDSP